MTTKFINVPFTDTEMKTLEVEARAARVSVPELVRDKTINSFEVDLETELDLKKLYATNEAFRLLVDSFKKSKGGAL